MKWLFYFFFLFLTFSTSFGYTISCRICGSSFYKQEREIEASYLRYLDVLNNNFLFNMPKEFDWKFNLEDWKKEYYKKVRVFREQILVGSDLTFKASFSKYHSNLLLHGQITDLISNYQITG